MQEKPLLSIYLYIQIWIFLLSPPPGELCFCVHLFVCLPVFMITPQLMNVSS